LGHPSNVQRVSRLGVTARHSSSGRQPIFAALHRRRHLYSEGRPSRWALAHILAIYIFTAHAQKQRFQLTFTAYVAMSCGLGVTTKFYGFEGVGFGLVFSGLGLMPCGLVNIPDYNLQFSVNSFKRLLCCSCNRSMHTTVTFMSNSSYYFSMLHACLFAS